MLGAGGTAASLGGGSTGSPGSISAGNLGIGGGDMALSDPQLKAVLLHGKYSERPAAGVPGRYYHVDAGSANLDTLYEDDGTSWSKVDLGVGSISADVTDIGNNVHIENDLYERQNIPNGASVAVTEFGTGSPTRRVTQRTTTVETTTAKAILDLSSSTFDPEGRVVRADVRGIGGGAYFYDIVTVSVIGGVSVVSSNAVRQSPAGRTYSIANSALKLAMASGTFTITVEATGGYA